MNYFPPVDILDPANELKSHRAVISTQGTVIGFLRTDKSSITFAGAVTRDGEPANVSELKASNAKQYKTARNWENTIDTDFVAHIDPRNGSTFYTIDR